MRFCGFLVLALVTLTGAAHAQDTARELLDAAIAAHGGEAALTKHPVMSVKTEGIFQGYKDKPVFFHKSESTIRGARQYRDESRFELNGTKVHVINVLDENQGWVKQVATPKSGQPLTKTEKCTPEQLARFQQNGYVQNLLTLVPLKNPEYQLVPAKIENDSYFDGVGIRVSHKGQRDVLLCFDKQTFLLSRVIYTGTAGTGDEGKVEIKLGKYEDVEGRKMPVSWEDWLNGQCLWSHYVVERKLSDTLPSGTLVIE